MLSMAVTIKDTARYWAPPEDYDAQIRAFRAEQGWTQTELARELGTSFASVNRWENRKHEPNEAMWERFCQMCEETVLEEEPTNEEGRKGHGMEMTDLIVEMLHTGHVEALQDVFSRLYGQREGFKEEALSLRVERGNREAEIGALKALVSQQTIQLMEKGAAEGASEDVYHQWVSEYHACNVTLNDIARDLEPTLSDEWDRQKLTDKCAWFVRFAGAERSKVTSLLEEEENWQEHFRHKQLVIAGLEVQVEERQKAIESLERQLSAAQAANLLLAEMTGTGKEGWTEAMVEREKKGADRMAAARAAKARKRAERVLAVTPTDDEG